MTASEKLSLQKTACKIRKGILESTHAAKCGHPGGSLSATEMFTYLYFKEMNVKPEEPKWAGRDRFVLSKGHTAPGLYAALAHRGFFPVEDLLTLRRIDSYLQGHPNMNTVPGVDMSTGSLGQGVSTAAGMALGLKTQGSDARVYTLLGDGEIQEGQVWEAAMFGAHRNLDNLVAIVDHNRLQIDGCVDDVCSPGDLGDKFRSFGWQVFVCEGNDMEAVLATLEAAKDARGGAPKAVIAETIKGKGVSFMEDQAGWHGKAPNAEQTAQAIEELTGKEVSNG
jgi:transketolase